MVLDMMRVWGLGLLIIAAIIFVTWLADPALPQQPSKMDSLLPPISQMATANNFSKVIDKGGVFQTVLVPAKNFLRRSILIQNNNSLLHNCWIYLGEGAPSKALSYLLLPGRSYERSAPFAAANAILATCDYNGDTLYIEAQ